MGLGDIFSGIGDGITGALGDSDFWSGLVTAGAGLFGQMQRLDAEEEASKYQKEQDKLNYLLQLQKLDLERQRIAQAGGGGGAGSLRNKNADLIEVLSKTTDQKLQALEQLTQGYLGAFRL